jgi:hypothetical protein
LAGCGGGEDAPVDSNASPVQASQSNAAESESSADPETGAGSDPESTSDAAEAAAMTPRLAIAYDGGIQIRDANTLELVSDIGLPGYLRVNPAGDGRHVLVTIEEEGFRLLDLGVWAAAHGDHQHYYTATPVLTDVVFPAVAPGHVVPHDDRTALFDDGTGTVTVLDAGELEEGLGAVLREHATAAAHHGVAVELPDGTLVVSEGTADGRTGIRVLDGAGTEIGASDECPDLHGEAVSADEAVTFGCSDGVIVYLDGQISKAPAPEPAGATSAMAGTEGSPVALGNYTVEGADASDPARVALVDTATAVERTVELPAAYGSGSLGRLEDGTGLVLGTDGKLHVIDVLDAAVTASYPVIGPWEVPENWQDPTPRLLVLNEMVYILDPAASALVVVDPVTGDIWKQTDLGVVPSEIAGVNGAGPGAHEHGDDEHEDED